MVTSTASGIYRNTFDISLSSCDPSSDIAVTVYATNAFGMGPTSDDNYISTLFTTFML